MAGTTEGHNHGNTGTRTRQRILVVDDNAHIREMCREMLEAEGYTVECARDGVEAVRKFTQSPVDLVICDIFMPEKDGIETILELSSEYHGVKIIAVSGGAQSLPDFLPFAKKLGATAALAKPFRPEELLEAVNALLAS